MQWRYGFYSKGWFTLATESETKGTFRSSVNRTRKLVGIGIARIRSFLVSSDSVAYELVDRNRKLK